MSLTNACINRTLIFMRKNTGKKGKNFGKRFQPNYVWSEEGRVKRAIPSKWSVLVSCFSSLPTTQSSLTLLVIVHPFGDYHSRGHLTYRSYGIHTLQAERQDLGPRTCRYVESGIEPPILLTNDSRSSAANGRCSEPPRPGKKKRKCQNWRGKKLQPRNLSNKRVFIIRIYNKHFF